MNLDATFAALADPTRRAILARLARGETTVQDLAEPFAMSLPAISKHLKVLERAGLISRSREAQWRPCRIEPRALKDVDDWLDRYRRFYDESFDRLDSYLKTLQAKDLTKGTKGRKKESRHGKDRLGNDRPGNDRPGNDRPGNDRPGNDRPGNDRPGRKQ